MSRDFFFKLLDLFYQYNYVQSYNISICSSTPIRFMDTLLFINYCISFYAREVKLNICNANLWITYLYRYFLCRRSSALCDFVNRIICNAKSWLLALKDHAFRLYLWSCNIFSLCCCIHLIFMKINLAFVMNKVSWS